MMKAILKNINTDRECITTPQAAEISGLSRVYITRLLREGAIQGFQLSHDWFIYTDSFDKFLSLKRKSGPKGPRKPKIQKTEEINK